MARQLDGHHRACRLPKLRRGEGMVGVVRKPDVVNLYALRLIMQPLCDGLCGCCLPLIAHIQRLQPQCLHVGCVRRHVCAEAIEHIGLHSFAEIRHCPVIDNKPTERCRAAREVFRGRHHLYVHAERMSRELREGYHRRVCHKASALTVAYLCQHPQVGNFQLRVSDNLYKHARRLPVHSLLHLRRVSQVADMRLHAEAR